MKKCFSAAIFFVMVLCTAGAVLAEQYSIPANAYADEVVRYSKGTGVYSIYPRFTSNFQKDHGFSGNALSAPDYYDDRVGGYTSLGWGGSLVLKFTDNSLTTSGNADKDLIIYEIGDKVELVHVFISQDNINWTSVGDTGKNPDALPGYAGINATDPLLRTGTFGIDIDAFVGQGVMPSASYNYVKLVDVNMPHLSYSPWAGADIDAVAALSTNSTVMFAKAAIATPEPISLILLGIGLIALAACRKQSII